MGERWSKMRQMPSEAHMLRTLVAQNIYPLSKQW
jgi:hypothetical protein